MAITLSATQRKYVSDRLTAIAAAEKNKRELAFREKFSEQQPTLAAMLVELVEKRAEARMPAAMMRDTVTMARGLRSYFSFPALQQPEAFEAERAAAHAALTSAVAAIDRHLQTSRDKIVLGDADAALSSIGEFAAAIELL